MTRKPRIEFVEAITLPLMGGCAWDGCGNGYRIDAGKLPQDWRWLAVWWGPPGLPPWAEGNVEDRDAVLCPEHAELLDSYLKDLGRRRPD